MNASGFDWRGLPVNWRTLDWRKFCRLADDILATLDVAAVNMVCAMGLPEAEKFDHKAVLDRLDNWAEYTRRRTEHNLPKYHQRPAEYDNSEALFRAVCLVSALQRDMGLRYNPEKEPDNVPLDVNDTFIMGAVFGAGGTCCSIPVVTAAVGRRLGYPIKLVEAQGKFGHLFARWDDPRTGTRFNIDGHRGGLVSRPDEEYRTGAYQVTPIQEQKLCLLKSKSPREELAWFVAQRGWRMKELGRTRQAAEAFGFALGMVPENKGFHNALAGIINPWIEKHKQSKPLGFPELYFKPYPPPRVYPPGLPEQVEMDILGETATEILLNDEELERDLWAPLRQGRLPHKPVPVEVHIHFIDTAQVQMTPHFRVLSTLTRKEWVRV